MLSVQYCAEPCSYRMDAASVNACANAGLELQPGTFSV